MDHAQSTFAVNQPVKSSNESDQENGEAFLMGPGLNVKPAAADIASQAAREVGNGAFTLY